jgi:hypothetical protein
VYLAIPWCDMGADVAANGWHQQSYSVRQADISTSPR